MRLSPLLSTIVFVLATVLRPLSAPLPARPLATATSASAPRSFLLKVPELQLEVPENNAAVLTNSFISRLELHILRSSQEIPPGKIVVRINGEAANIIMSTRASDSAIVCDLDLNFRPGFLLHSGRNSVEASAESIYGRPFYAVFLLDVQDEPPSLQEVQREVFAGKPGERPPSIHLINPQGAVENVRELSLQGYIAGGAAPVTLTVQGEPVRLKSQPLAASTRNLAPESPANSLRFDTQIALASQQDHIELVATDANHNRAQLRIPVIQGSRTPHRRWAVVIGISRYASSRINQLQFADRDAQAIRDFLVDPKGGAVPPENVLYLTNEEATYPRIRSALFDFLAKPGPDDLAIIYFAGHGSNDFKKRPDNYYLLGYDADPDNLAATAFPMWDLQIAMERTLQADVVTLVDACHSGGIGQAVPNMTNERWLKAGFGQNRAIITASDVDEVSSEGDQWGGHGVFTYYLLQGLKGGADLRHDRKITIGELFDFVRPKVEQATGGAQKPRAQPGLARGVVLTPGAQTAANLKMDSIRQKAQLQVRYVNY